MRGHMNEELEPFIDPKDTLGYMETGTPGYKVPVQSAVLRLRPKTTITWHADVPRNTTVEVDAHVPRLGTFWEIIKELAENATAFRRYWGAYECPFCHVIHDVLDSFQHDDTCIVTKARSLVCELESGEDRV
jgi:hypothetical protein